MTRRSGSGSPHRRAVAVALVAVLATGALFVASEIGLAPHLGRETGAPAVTGVVPPPTGPGLDLRSGPSPPSVLPAADGGLPVSFRRLRAHLAQALALPGIQAHFGLAVSQLGNLSGGLHLGASEVTPASTLKLVTTTAALSALGAGARFTTTVVRGLSRGSIVLVGGGDPLLVDAAPTGKEATGSYPRPASLQRLAGEVADRLTAQGVRRVRLGYDASLFTGPAVNPRWPATYIREDVVSPISALWINEGRIEAGLAPRSADPANAAALAFRARLTHDGIRVLGEPAPTQEPRGRESVVAAVSSAPLDEIVEHILETSDNEGAEVLLRQVALAAGLPGSTQAGVAAVRRELTTLGLNLDKAVIDDGSGLSRLDVLPVALLLDVLEITTSTEHPQLRAAVTGLPVAGFSGSLTYRFASPGPAEEGLGYVRAKTGTLTGVHAYAGMAVTRSGQVLLFVAVANRVPVSMTLEARDDLDRVVASLATCGC